MKYGTQADRSPIATPIAHPLGTRRRISVAITAPTAVPTTRSTARENTEPKSGFITRQTVRGTQNQWLNGKYILAPTAIP